MRKDLRLAFALAEELGVPLAAVRAADEVLAQADGDGRPRARGRRRPRKLRVVSSPCLAVLLRLFGGGPLDVGERDPRRTQFAARPGSRETRAADTRRGGPAYWRAASVASMAVRGYASAW